MRKLLLVGCAVFGLAIATAARAQCPAGSTTTVFSYTGTEQQFVVPAGVTSVYIDAYGAQGSPGLAPAGGAGGLGGRAGGTLAVTPGQTLYVYVGGGNGGGAGGNANSGAGGGASDIRVGGSSLANRILVAGGGGGGGGTGCEA